MQSKKESSSKQDSQSSNRKRAAEANGQAGGKEQDTPLSIKGRQLSEQIDSQIQRFKQQLELKSNSELMQVSKQLDAVEREVVLNKIDNQLKAIKKTVIRPGDTASTAVTGVTVAASVSSQSQPSVERPENSAT